MANDIQLVALGGLVGAVFLLAFLPLRGAFERRRLAERRRLTGKETDSEHSGVLIRALGTGPRPAGRFAQMIRGTGLAVGPGQALGVICLVGVLLGTALLVWRGQLWLGGLGLAVGSAATFGVFWMLHNRQRRRLQSQMPDAFYLLARSLRAGLSLEQAIAMAGEEGEKPLADEFRLCSQQIGLGLTVSAALQLTARRIRLLDFDALVSTVAMYQTTGGNLPMLLDRLAAGTRDRNQLRNHFLAATALGRATAIALALSAPALLLAYAIFQPSWGIEFFRHRAGWTTLGVCLGLEAVGAVWLYNLLRFDT